MTLQLYIKYGICSIRILITLFTRVLYIIKTGIYHNISILLPVIFYYSGFLISYLMKLMFFSPKKSYRVLYNISAVCNVSTP
ncbi:MPPV-014 Ig-like domain protein [Magpiepox virus 2]|nr:MPPV-014 Ig-like domain protein [Magpiepox virus 2]